MESIIEFKESSNGFTGIIKASDSKKKKKVEDILSSVHSAESLRKSLKCEFSSVEEIAIKLGIQWELGDLDSFFVIEKGIATKVLSKAKIPEGNTDTKLILTITDQATQEEIQYILALSIHTLVQIKDYKNFVVNNYIDLEVAKFVNELLKPKILITQIPSVKSI